MEQLRPNLKNGARLKQEGMEAAFRKGKVPYDSMETILKGVEVKLPGDKSFLDKDKNLRRQIRTKWWNPDLTTYRSAYIGPAGVEITDEPIEGHDPIPEPVKPTFIGHYWFNPNDPLEPASKLVACVDYSVANNGLLVAYRFDGEQQLSKDKFVAV